MNTTLNITDLKEIKKYYTAKISESNGVIVRFGLFTNGPIVYPEHIVILSVSGPMPFGCNDAPVDKLKDAICRAFAERFET